MKVLKNIGMGILLILTIFLWLLTQPFPSLSVSSPCKQYVLMVYTHPSFFAMPGGGGFGSRSTTVVLRNKWGWKIGQSTKECSLPYDSMEIEWDYNHQEVWYGRSKSIDLKSGECSC